MYALPRREKGTKNKARVGYIMFRRSVKDLLEGVSELLESKLVVNRRERAREIIPRALKDALTSFSASFLPHSRPSFSTLWQR